jgi:hypothetical protein
VIKFEDLRTVSQQDLEAEIRRRQVVEMEDEKARKEKLAAFALQNIDVLLAMFPEHSRNTCSDLMLNNGLHSCANGGFRCTRCFLLGCKQQNYWPFDYEVEVSIRRGKELM